MQQQHILQAWPTSADLHAFMSPTALWVNSAFDFCVFRVDGSVAPRARVLLSAPRRTFILRFSLHIFAITETTAAWFWQFHQHTEYTNSCKGSATSLQKKVERVWSVPALPSGHRHGGPAAPRPPVSLLREREVSRWHRPHAGLRCSTPSRCPWRSCADAAQSCTPSTCRVCARPSSCCRCSSGRAAAGRGGGWWRPGRRRRWRPLPWPHLRGQTGQEVSEDERVFRGARPWRSHS